MTTPTNLETRITDAMYTQAIARAEAAEAKLAKLIPTDLRHIGHLLQQQDNRITDQPIFIVQQKREYAADPDRNDGARIIWVNDGGEEADSRKSKALDRRYDRDGIEPPGYERIYIGFYWEFVTACFTEQGCKDYIALNGHNLKEPRIYATGSFRNAEYQAVRRFLMANASEAHA